MQLGDELFFVSSITPDTLPVVGQQTGIVIEPLTSHSISELNESVYSIVTVPLGSGDTLASLQKQEVDCPFALTAATIMKMTAPKNRVEARERLIIRNIIVFVSFYVHHAGWPSRPSDSFVIKESN